MRLIASDPDIRTIVGRLEQHLIDLQPEFQRGQAWSVAKRQRLIDSILRQWHVPPIHLVETRGGKLEVLDGQQRLRSILEFAQDELKVDGSIQPSDKAIEALDGMHYSSLPRRWRSIFDQFSIRQFVIVDYKPSEPFELFYRLNQTVALTPPEQRNAFYGPARSQVKELAAFATDAGMNSASIGFANSRMAYEDVIARAGYTLSTKSLSQRVTADALAELFREQAAFPNRTERLLRKSILLVVQCAVETEGVRLNKATLYSWLLYFGRHLNHSNPRDTRMLSDLMRFLGSRRDTSQLELLSATTPPAHQLSLRDVFLDRASARVADASSVLLRDATLWLLTPPALVPEPLRRRLRQLQRHSLWDRDDRVSEAALLEAAALVEWDEL